MPTLALVAALVNLVLLAAVFGVFFTYSNSVVPGLDRTDPERAVEAMRKMNAAIVNPAFLVTFVGPLVTSAGTGFLLLGLDTSASAYLHLGAALVYLVGSLAVTGRVNVPLNNALENGTATWADFSPRWRRWNTVRTLSSGAALVLCGAGLHLG
ncbi:DUF1772 domain-containing protein [Actinophytocola oryzae]|uniref:Putative membrane protein n=1 Tax=Actinophytocola oryzae TaxID=502181 RepID=A0A4R7VV98_9PSEU|nr:anthrone oxygenase family protein [Actinophytocola oryzae]TDV53782.1 putative membrane protein [Actinophytocola oryzae]